jgi:hypothetical protein
MSIEEPLPEQLQEENPVESPANPQPGDTEQTNKDAATSTEPPGQVAKSTEGVTVGGTTKEPPASPEDAAENQAPNMPQKS